MSSSPATRIKQVKPEVKLAALDWKIKKSKGPAIGSYEADKSLDVLR